MATELSKSVAGLDRDTWAWTDADATLVNIPTAVAAIDAFEMGATVFCLGYPGSHTRPVTIDAVFCFDADCTGDDLIPIYLGS